MKKCHYISFILFSLCIFGGSWSTNQESTSDVAAGLQISEEISMEDQDTEKSGDDSEKKKGNSAKQKKKTTIVFASDSVPERTIEVNSVNFIKLKAKANEIFIPDPEIIDVQLLSNNSLYLIGLEPGVTSLVINDKKGNTLINCKVKVTYPIKSIQKAVKELHPDASIEIVSIDDSIVLKGRVPSPEAAKEVSDVVARFIDEDKIINRLKIETSTQVMLKLKIAEVERSLNNSLGLHWRAYSAANGLSGASFGFMSGDTTTGFMGNLGDTSSGEDSSDSSGSSSSSSSGSSSSGGSSSGGTSGGAAGGGAAGGGAAGGDGAGGDGAGAGAGDGAGDGTGDGAGAADVAGAAAGAAAAAVVDVANTVKTNLMSTDEGSLLVKNAGSRWVFHTNGRRGLAGLIDALATESFATVLAEPTLIAISGKTATFKVGGEQGYKVKQEGSDSYTTEFKDWGTEVEFTPVVLSEDRINLTVSPTVSTLAMSGDGEPSLSTKEVSTTVELGSGESMAIAGLLQVTKGISRAENPFFSKIPILGALFRSSTTATTEKELIIIITPYIVKPSTKQLKTPVDMVPRMFSPFMSILTGKSHETASKYKNIDAAGFSIK